MEGFLLQVADRVAELGTTAEQSAILMTVMGDAGRRLVPFMAQGAEGIRELMERARELGLVMDETQIRRLAAFNDRVDILGRRFAATGREIGYMFLPAVEAVIGLIEDATSFKTWTRPCAPTLCAGRSLSELCLALSGLRYAWARLVGGS